jgi:hypothetical protein
MQQHVAKNDGIEGKLMGIRKELNNYKNVRNIWKRKAKN